MSTEPGEDHRSRWSGAGGALSFDVCYAIRAVAASEKVPSTATARARGALAEIRYLFWFLVEDSTTIERDEGRSRAQWWTFAGGRANAELRGRLEAVGIKTSSRDDLGISLLGNPSPTDASDPQAGEIDWRRAEAVKFHEAAPAEELAAMLRARDADSDGMTR